LDKLRKTRAVLFDIDDTIFDRNRAQHLALEIIVRKLPEVFKNLEKERIKAAFIESDLITTRDFDAGAPSEGLRDIRSRLFLRILGISEEYTHIITHMYVREYPAVNAPVPGVKDIVSKLGGKYEMGIVSNGFADVQYTKLDTIGLRQKFTCIVLSEEIGIRKPDPKIFQHAIDVMNLKPGECIYVGNSYTNDVIGAAHAGMTTCWFNREQLEPGIGDIQPDFIINDLSELTTIL
jgi:HAD superfamily hydrolase (TIGR01549 family)